MVNKSHIKFYEDWSSISEHIYMIRSPLSQDNKAENNAAQHTGFKRNST
jgi:hypothetical protein